MAMTRTIRSALVVAMAATAGCLNTDAPEEASIEETKFASSLGVDLAASTKTENGAYYRDLVPGAGSSLTSGTLYIRYTGWLSNGIQFDSNLSSQTPLKFTFGAHDVLTGFEEAMMGVKVGATRQLILPPSLAYGQYDYGPIPGNSVLVFKVEVVSAE
jgi:FKBP-type peptidyl-prolyl cis-trans isomerase